LYVDGNSTPSTARCWAQCFAVPQIATANHACAILVLQVDGDFNAIFSTLLPGTSL
jgi:hypothetical protein